MVHPQTQGAHVSRGKQQQDECGAVSGSHCHSSRSLPEGGSGRMNGLIITKEQTSGFEGFYQVRSNGIVKDKR